MSYDIGDRRKLTCEIRDEAGDLADPDELSFQMREPNRTTTTYTHGTDTELVKEDTGTYHVYWTCARAGLHRYRFIATGTIACAEGSQFRVGTTVFSAP